MFVILTLLPLFGPRFFYDEIPRSDTNQIKVLTYNLHFGQDSDGQYDLDKLIEFLISEEPNVIGFQELTYYSSFNGYAFMYNELAIALDQLGYKYSYYPSKSNYYSLANAIFSQYEILEANTIDLEPIVSWQRMSVDVLLNVNGFETRVYVTHLTHIPGNGKSGSERLQQLQLLLDQIKTHNVDTENIILMGDFNIVELYDDEEVEEYNIIVEILKDAWLNSTYQISDYGGYTSSADDPNKRIDYIFLSDQIQVSSCEVVTTLVSDHFPLFCTITLA